MLPTLSDLRPGDIMFGRIENRMPRFLPKPLRFIPGTFPVAAGQRLLAATTPSEKYIHHVAVVTASSMIVQAMPSGAEEIEIGDEHWTADYVYVRPDYASMPNAFQLDVSGEHVAWEARKRVETPYSFVDYAALAVRHGRHLKPSERTWVDKYISNSGRMICSQLADQAMSDAGWHNFDDGRPPQDVMPVELFRQLLRMSGQHVRPGQDWQTH